MPATSHITSVVNRPAAGGYVLLEQEPWGDNTGHVTRLDLVQALAEYMGEEDGAEVDCGLDGDVLGVNVFAYPSPTSLSFDFGVTSGLIQKPRRVEVTVRESLPFSLDTTRSLSYPASAVDKYEWASEVWGAEGGVVASPAISVSGQDVSVATPVYGTVYVTYKTVRFVYPVRITPREESVENVYSSYGWCRWDGGCELMRIEPPDNAEENYELDRSCTGGSNVIIDPDPDDPQAPTVDGKNKTVYLDYCENY